MRIGMVDSRELSSDGIRFCEHLGETAARRGHTVVSGNAVGADQAYARGASRINPQFVNLKLPWKNFESAAAKDEYTVESTYDEATTLLAAEHHPMWAVLSTGVKKLMTRNAAIVSGADALIAFQNRVSESGGTYHGIKIANALHKPLIEIAKAGFEGFDYTERAEHFIRLLEIAHQKVLTIEDLVEVLAKEHEADFDETLNFYDKNKVAIIFR